jgi:hypothetical protein
MKRTPLGGDVTEPISKPSATSRTPTSLRPNYSPSRRSGVRSTGSASSISFVKMRSERL